jgi:hypothetical protein
MSADRARRDEQARGNFRIGETFGGEQDDLPFRGGQAGQRIRR